MATVLEMGWQLSLVQRRKSRPPLGLRNLGNTCYLNSVLQCLTYTPPLANLCLKNHHSSVCQKLDASGKRECPFCILEKRITRSLSLEAQNDAPSRIGSCVCLYAEHFQRGRQEDAHEFLRYVIDTCHNTCLKLLKTAGSPTSNGVTSDHHINGDSKTIVKDIFGGSLINQVKCLSCGNESKKIDEIMDISLDLFQSNTLKDALRRFFQPEVLDGDNKYSCDKCKKLSAAKKQMSVLHAPNVLVIQLKRFEGAQGGKINRDISFEEVLLLSSFMSKASQDPCPEYSLFGSIVHSGYSPDSGHYYAYIKDPTGRWYCCNDSYVSLSTSQEVLSEKVYILFYLRSNQRPKCLNFSENGHSQDLINTAISNYPKLRTNGTLSERNVPSLLKKSKASTLQIKLQSVKNTEKSSIATSAIGSMQSGNKSPVMGNTEKLFTSSENESDYNRICNGMITIADKLPNSISHSSDTNASSLVSRDVANAVSSNGKGNVSSRKVEKLEISNVPLVIVDASRCHSLVSNSMYTHSSNALGDKRKAHDDFDTPLDNRSNEAAFVASDDPQSVRDVKSVKKLLAEEASSYLRMCGWVNEVKSFMHARKKLCMKEVGFSHDPVELRKALIASAKKIFIPELPEALKQNLVRQLQSFSNGKMSLDA